jgi:hypothetical protein
VARHRVGPIAPSGVVAAGEPDQSATTGVSRRERRNHGDDAPLWTCPTRRTGTRSRTCRTLAHSDIAGAISLEGVVAAMTIESPTDGDIFLSYVEQVLCPRLRPGQVVVMDNLSAHKTPPCASASSRPGQNCCICRHIRPTLIPSNSAGRKSKNTCGPLRLACSTYSNRRLRKPSHCPKCSRLVPPLRLWGTTTMIPL